MSRGPARGFWGVPGVGVALCLVSRFRGRGGSTSGSLGALSWPERNPRGRHGSGDCESEQFNQLPLEAQAGGPSTCD